MKKLLQIFTVLTINTTFAGSVISCQFNNFHPDDNDDYQYKYTMLSTGSGLFQYLKINDSAIIYDTGIGGPPAQWRNKLYAQNNWPTNYLKNDGIKNIKAIFFSHFHTDHYANLPSILKNFSVDNIIFNYESKEFLKAFTDMINKSTKILPFGPTYHFAGITFNNWSYYAKDFLATEYQKTRVNHNNLSNIISFNLGKTSFLFTGDAEQALGKAIKKAKPDLFKPIDFYQVPHHGSKNALDLSFYQPLQPKFCFIPSTYGPENSPWRKFMGAPTHQFPAGSVIDNLKSAGCQRIDVTGEPYPGLTPHQLKLIDHVNHTINVYFDRNGQILKTDYDQATILQSL